MNVRLCRNLTLIAALLAAGPAMALETNRLPSASAAGQASTQSDKAAEAQRLATLAAELAKQAASLAAESQSTSPAEPATSQQEKPQWQSSATDQVQISDHDQASATNGSVSGWRSHQKTGDVAIRFMGDAASGAAKSAGTPAIGESSTASATKADDAAIAKNDDAAAAASREDSADGIAKGKTIQDANVQLVVGTRRDRNILAADGAEPMPAPGPAYNDRKGEPQTQGNYQNGGCDSCDGGCNVGCCEPQPVLFWTAGVEATFLNPDLNNQGVTFEVDEYSKGRADWFGSASDDTDSVYLSPRIWLGVQGCKWGANIRYWHLQAGEGFFDPSLGIDGEWDGYGCGRTDIGCSSCSHLEAYTVDLEITRRFCMNDCWMQASGGIRHAELSLDQSIIGNAIADDSNVMAYARSNAQVRGTGVYLGLYGRKPVFPCSCVNWFYNVRWSALWGPTETSAETAVILAVTDQDGVANAGSTNGASTAVDDTWFVGEIQLGLEWDYSLRCIPANAFFRAAIEYQRWDGGRGYSAADSFAGVEINDIPTTFAEVTSAAINPQMDLVGISLGTGLTW